MRFRGYARLRHIYGTFRRMVFDRVQGYNFCKVGEQMLYSQEVKTAGFDPVNTGSNPVAAVLFFGGDYSG